MPSAPPATGKRTGLDGPTAVGTLLLLLTVSLAWGKHKPATQYSIPLPPVPDYSALEWLIGEWSGKTTTHSPSGEVHLSATWELDKRFMVLRGELALPATPTQPASKEAWLGVLGAQPSGQGYSLRMFSSTGFVSRYLVTVDGPEIRLDPEGGEQPPPGWLFRRMLQRISPTEMTETVQAAPPSKPFFQYYTARLTREAVAQKSGVKP